MSSVFLFFSILLFFIPVSEAVSWHTLQTSAKMTLQADEPQVETTVESPTDKPKKKDRKLKIWDKISYTQAQQAKPGDFYYTTAKFLAEINCTTRTLKPLQRIYFDGDGNEIKSIHYGSTERIESVEPETPGEALFNFACNFKPGTVATKVTPSPAPPPKAVTEKPAAASATSKKNVVEKPKSPEPSKAKALPKPPGEPKSKPVATKKTAG